MTRYVTANENNPDFEARLQQIASETGADDPRFIPAMKMLGRTGVSEMHIRYSDDQEPVVWMATGRWDEHWEACGAMTVIDALLRLCERVIDGGMCRSCHRPTAFVPELDVNLDLLDKLACVYAWDPELETFRRGCEGDDK